MVTRQEIVHETGRALRRARQARGLTLRDVGQRSGGAFKPTAVAAYERGERAISLERFYSLARLYDMAPDRLLSQVIWRIERRPEPTIDRTRLAELPADDAATLGGFIDEVRRLRGNSDDDVIAIRIHDVEVLATATGHPLPQFLERLRPAFAAPTLPG
jgi:transcriptional regulator with XRE-family HTH domain